MVDLRSLRPLDEATLLASVAKTGRAVIVQEAPRTAGFGAEVAALIAEKAILDLRAPVLRVTGYDVPYPVLAARGRVPAVRRARPRRGRGASSSMAYEFQLPDLGEGLTEGEVARWLVAEGQQVAEDDPLVEIQTDKTTVEIPSPAAGTVARDPRRRGRGRPGRDGAGGDRRGRRRAPPAASGGRAVRGGTVRRGASARRRSCAASPRSSASTSRRCAAPARAGGSPRATSGRRRPAPRRRPRDGASRSAASAGRSSSTWRGRTRGARGHVRRGVRLHRVDVDAARAARAAGGRA